MILLPLGTVKRITDETSRRMSADEVWGESGRLLDVGGCVGGDYFQPH